MSNYIKPRNGTVTFFLAPSKKKNRINLIIKILITPEKVPKIV